MPSGADYRLEGWIQCRAGEARLGLDLLDERGRAVSRPAAARIHAGSAWQYVALEINTGKATRARVWFRVKGQATLDDVALVSDAIAFMGNKGLEPDDRGRIPFWNEEKDDSVLKGRRAGELRTDTETKREGKASALVAAAGDWFGIASINYPLTPSTDTYELSAWTRCVEPASAMLLACWTDDQTKVLRVDQSAAVKSQDWQEIRLRVMA